MVAISGSGLGWLDGCLRQGKGLFWILEPAQQENHAGNSSLDWFKGKFDLNPQYISWLKHVKTVKTHQGFQLPRAEKKPLALAPRSLGLHVLRG